MVLVSICCHEKYLAKRVYNLKHQVAEVIKIIYNNLLRQSYIRLGFDLESGPVATPR